MNGISNEYYFHPLGDLAKAFAEGTADSNEWAHTYDTDENGESFGISSLDWGSGSSIPKGSSIYSMTNGTIYNISANHDKNNLGFSIYIKTDKTDGTGKPICIYYTKLGGVSDKLSNILGCSSGALSLDEYNSISINYSEPIPITIGEQIGYTNSWYGNYANFHTDFVYENNIDSTIDKDSFPHIENEKQLNDNFSLESANGNIAEYVVKCNGKLVGNSDGMVRLQNGKSSQYYSVYPFISYLVCQQAPTYIENTTTGSDGGIILDNSKLVKGSDMDETGVNFYYNGQMGTAWAGIYPNTINEISMGLHHACGICKQELNFSAQGTFPGIAYAKLLRAKMSEAQYYGVGKPNNMEEWFSNLYAQQFANKNSWMAYRENNLTYAQTVYKNIVYPNLYGSEDFTGTKEFLEAIIYACSQIPFSNLALGEGGLSFTNKAGGFAFIVQWDVSANKDLGTSWTGMNKYLLYRARNGCLKKFRQDVLR